MKLKSTLLAITMLAASLAGATPGATTSVDDPALQIFAAAQPSPGCATNGSSAELPAFEVAPKEQGTLPCGSCSVPKCQGKFIGEICDYRDGRYYTCGVVNFCSAMGGGTGRFCDCPGNY